MDITETDFVQYLLFVQSVLLFATPVRQWCKLIYFRI